MLFRSKKRAEARAERLRLKAKAEKKALKKAEKRAAKAERLRHELNGRANGAGVNGKLLSSNAKHANGELTNGHDVKPAISAESEIFVRPRGRAGREDRASA